ARDRRCGPDVHRDDRRVAGGAYLAGLRRHVQRRARGGVGAHRRFRARAGAHQVLPAAPPCRAPGGGQADVGGHRRGAAGRALAEPRPEGAWPIISASPWPYSPYSAVPREMTRADMDKVIADYVAATKRGHRAGFDMVEMHAAHGYLLASFISPLTNARRDKY